VRTDVSEEFIATNIWVETIIVVGTTLVFLHRVLLLLVTANVPSSPILLTLMLEVIRSAESLAVKKPHGVISQETKFFKA
jgi:hypothetical protein